MIGATSGIGAAMADRLVQEGSKVIAVGRRQDRLDVFVHRHGNEKTSAVRFDITDQRSMDDFVKKFAAPLTPDCCGNKALTTIYLASQTPIPISTVSF